MTNYEIADHFALLSKLMDIHGENSFKSKSYSIAAYNIEKLPKEISDMSEPELYSMKGIGDSLGKKILALQNTGVLDLLQEIISRTPPGILEMLQVKGIGPKKIALIWKEMGIETIGELEYACNENRLVVVKGFGAKTQQGILDSIKFIKANSGYHLWADVEETANGLLKQLETNFPENKFALTGDYRRQNETLSHIAVLTTLDKPNIHNAFQNIPDIAMENEGDDTIVVKLPQQPTIKFFFTDKASFAHKLFLTSGSIEFIEAFHKQYSLPIDIEDEEEIFSKNNLPFIHPAQRETSKILEVAASGQLKKLIEPTDIKGIIHSHSTWSDGQNTIEEMAKAAIDKGFEYLVLSDHSQAAYYAQGLKPEQVAAQHHEVDALNEKLAPFKIFKSIEADILGDGSLDYNEQILATFDLVIASVHSNLKMTEEKAMDRVMKAIQNPFTTILGHPTGRLLLSREGYPLDHKKIIDACAQHRVVIEINAHPKRLDLDWRWIDYALEQGVLLSIDPDAHAVAGYKDIYYGVLSAQKGGLTKQQNLSSYSLAEFETFLANRKK